MIHIGTSGYSYEDWKGHFYPEAIKDNELADEAAEIERDEHADTAVTRGRMHAAIESRYTAAA